MHGNQSALLFLVANLAYYGAMIWCFILQMRRMHESNLNPVVYVLLNVVFMGFLPIYFLLRMGGRGGSASTSSSRSDYSRSDDSYYQPRKSSAFAESSSATSRSAYDAAEKARQERDQRIREQQEADRRRQEEEKKTREYYEATRKRNQEEAERQRRQTPGF